jgi:hypothetical protein
MKENLPTRTAHYTAVQAFHFTKKLDRCVLFAAFIYIHITDLLTSRNSSACEFVENVTIIRKTVLIRSELKKTVLCKQKAICGKSFIAILFTTR